MKKMEFSKTVVMIIATIGMLATVACGSGENYTEIPKEAEISSEELPAGGAEISSEELPGGETEISSEELPGGETEISSEELLAEDAIGIAEEGFRAIKEMNPEKMIEHTNIELLYYMGSTEMTDNEAMLEKITALVNEMDENYNSMGIVGHYAAIENIELYDAELVTTEEIDELNAMLTDGNLADRGVVKDYQYRIQKAYKLKMSYEAMEEEKESYMLVVCSDDHWELDVCLAVMRDMYQMIMQKEQEFISGGSPLE